MVLHPEPDFSRWVFPRALGHSHHSPFVYTTERRLDLNLPTRLPSRLPPVLASKLCSLGIANFRRTKRGCRGGRITLDLSTLVH